MSELFETLKKISIAHAKAIALEHGKKVKNCKCVESVPMLGELCNYCRFQNLSESEFEAFAEKAFGDVDCMSAFIETNYEDFEQAMNERGIYPDYYCDHESSYCETHDDSYLEFAFGYFNKAKAG
jgi:hypothetical protein